MRAAAILILSTLVAGCGAGVAPVVQEPAPPPSVRLAGEVLYEARSPTPTGASEALQVRPARQVHVQAFDPAGQVLAETWADDAGRFDLQAPASATYLTVWTRTENAALAVAAQRGGEGVYGMRVDVQGQPGGVVHRIVATDAQEGIGGAFHILDTLLSGRRAVQEWTGRDLPPFFAYWGRGVTTSWSYYHGECPEGSGRYCIELLGGDPGQQRTTDTDEHDEVIVLHEFGHFVMDVLTTSSSHGGDHPGGFLIDPGLAWEEGRASWLAVAVLGRPFYQDTIGLQGSGRLRVDHDVEHGAAYPKGIGSEQGVVEILWDLADGEGGLADQDADGVALGPAAVLQAMVELRDRVPGAYPCISTFLRYLVDRGTADQDRVKTLLARGGHPQELLPNDGISPWPEDIGVPGEANGKVDGLSDPAPSGGPPRPQNGVDALKVYRFHLAERGRMMIELRIFGSGRVADREDLDLELRDIRGELLQSARTEKPVETLSTVLDPGHYIIYVRDGGNGNRVGFELSLRPGL